MILPPEDLVRYVLSLEGRRRLVALFALRVVFRILESDREWSAHIRACLDELKPSREEHQAIVEESHRVARDLRAALGKAP